MLYVENQPKGTQHLNERREQRQDIIFFFGAGASVDADIPDTYRFVEEFKRFIKRNPSLYHYLLSILQIREAFNERNFGPEKRQVDVEQLLDTLTRLMEKDKDVLLDFHEKLVLKKDVAEDTKLLSKLKKLLEDFIRERVIIKEEKNLEYLKELLKFVGPSPLEVYSVNYDTCVEQLTHVSHMRYTDGFDTYWNKENFSRNFDVKHYKMHGSVIWYENKKTKEIVKIPVHAFSEKKPVKLRLIYGEDVEPLLIYPAQKMEYIEPLTELQLMFKERLVSEETRILVVVGYSFRDDYIVHMLWDAGRINNDLHIILVSPKAQKHFEEKLRFIDRDKRAPSRIHDRVVCLPYPFHTVINQLRNHYLQQLRSIIGLEKRFLEQERSGREKIDWEILLRICIGCEFLTKAEYLLNEKIMKRWIEVFDIPRDCAVLAMKAMLHSVITQNELQDNWLNRVNESFKLLSVENLHVSDPNQIGFQLMFAPYSDFEGHFHRLAEGWIDPILEERRNRLEMLTAQFEKRLSKTRKSFECLERFRNYLRELQFRVKWEKYFELRSRSSELTTIKKLLQSKKEERFQEMGKLVLRIERNKLRKIFGGENFRFQLQD